MIQLFFVKAVNWQFIKIVLGLQICPKKAGIVKFVQLLVQKLMFDVAFVHLVGEHLSKQETMVGDILHVQFGSNLCASKI
jgi:hypothetical protein